MSINTIPFKPQGNTPRAIVKINGEDLTIALIEAEHNESTYYQADKFSINLAINKLPTAFNARYFSSTPAILVEIYMGFPADRTNYTTQNLTNLITGQVDDVEINLPYGLIILSGRDLTAKFIDNKTTEKFLNHTSSQVAIKLAQRRGLTPVVNTTTTRIGLYYANNSSRLTQQYSEWDLLTFLAQEENFNVYVRGQSLYFKPLPKESDNPYITPYSVPNSSSGSPAANVINLIMHRNLTLARDVIVKVRSFNSQDKKAYTITAKATPNKKTKLASAAQPVGDAQVYTYIYPGLTREQAIQKAQQLLRLITKEERIVDTELVPDVILHKENIVKITNTGTDFDQIYYPYNINRKISIEGFEMSATMKNHSPNTQVLI